MKKSLLPSSASPLEDKILGSFSESLNLNLTNTDLWNPEKCPITPTDLLPYLAWAFSIEEWDESWSEEIKRRVIASSVEVHRRKGTLAALKEVFESLNLDLDITITITEWFNQVPIGEAYTFKLDINPGNETLTEEYNQRLNRIISNTINARSHLQVITINLNSQGNMRFAQSLMSGESTKILPFIVGELSHISQTPKLGLGQYSVIATRLLPFQS